MTRSQAMWCLDFLLIYQVLENLIDFAQAGTHYELFSSPPHSLSFSDYFLYGISRRIFMRLKPCNWNAPIDLIHQFAWGNDAQGLDGIHG